MNQSRDTSPAESRDTPADAGERDARRAEQPPATGANRGSPAAPVMKEFQKTENESSGRS